MENLKEKLGQQIRKIRKSKNYTQEKLSELINIEVPSLSNIETGKFAPSFETIQKLSEALNVKIKDFYDFDELSEKEMQTEIIELLKKNSKLIPVVYNFLKSIEYKI